MQILMISWEFTALVNPNRDFMGFHHQLGLHINNLEMGLNGNITEKHGIRSAWWNDGIVDHQPSDFSDGYGMMYGISTEYLWNSYEISMENVCQPCTNGWWMPPDGDIRCWRASSLRRVIDFGAPPAWFPDVVKDRQRSLGRMWWCLLAKQIGTIFYYFNDLCVFYSFTV